MNNPVRILLLAGHPIVGNRVRQMLEHEADLLICAEADTHEAALEAFRIGDADLAVLIVDPSPESSLDVVGQLRGVNSTLPLVVVSRHDERFAAEQALRAGARAYVMKKDASESLIPAIRQVLAGRLYVSPQVLQDVLNRIIGGSA
jgi:DNA-binding NarL/FixJ family response regulator